MSEFINEFGKENFIIIIAVVAAIVLALVIIIFIEKLQAKRARKKQVERELANFNKMNSSNIKKPVNIEVNEPVKEDKFLEEKVYEEKSEVLEDVVSNDEENDYSEEIKKPSFTEEKKYEDVFYVENVNPREEAKEKLEEVTKKLIEEDSDLIEHTHFETEQEEKSIISYEELVKASHDIDNKNDKLLEDEGEAAITLEELYQKHVDTQNIIEDEVPEVKVNNPVFEDAGERKFKNSEVISPVFGVYSGKSKPIEKKEPIEILEELDDAVGMKDLEAEIEKTEEFLSELKRLKNKLD